MGISPTRARRWIRGYTYLVHLPQRDERRSLPPVVAHDLPRMQGRWAISFLELMELRVVRDLVDRYGYSLQHVRKVAKLARRHFHTTHPLANRNIYVEGQRGIFAAPSTRHDDPTVVELSPRRILQLSWKEMMRPFLQDVAFDPRSGLVERWWPMGKGTPVVLDPAVVFGAPTVEGTRVQTVFVAESADAQALPRVVELYALTKGQVRAAVAFESQLRAA